MPIPCSMFPTSSFLLSRVWVEASSPQTNLQRAWGLEDFPNHLGSYCATCWRERRWGHYKPVAPVNLSGDLQEWDAKAWEKRVMVALHLDPQASPNILTFLLASREMSLTLNPTTLCREADVPRFTIPSDPVPEMDKLKISLTAKLHSTFPPLRREAWEWLQWCKQLNLEAPRGNWKQPGQSAHQHPPPGTRWTYLFQVLTCTSLLLLPSHPHFLCLCAGAAVHRL